MSEITPKEKKNRESIIELTLFFNVYNLFILAEEPEAQKVFKNRPFLDDFNAIYGYLYAEDIPESDEIRKIFYDFERKYSKELTFCRDWLPAFLPKYDC